MRPGYKTLTHPIYYAALACLVLIGVSSIAWSGVHPPLYVNIQSPEKGFTPGEEAVLTVSTWIPDTGIRDESSIRLHLAGTGVAHVAGAQEWLVHDVVLDEIYQFSAVVRIVGAGEGEWRLEASSYDDAGERLWGAAETLYVLQAGDEILFGKSSDYHLLERKLEQNRNKGLLSDAAFEREMRKLLSGEKTKWQREVKGLPAEEYLPSVREKSKVEETRVSGRITYTHRTGRVGGVNEFAAEEDARPLAEMLVEFYDRDGDAETKLDTAPAEVRTDGDGRYTNVQVPGERDDGTAVNLEVQFIFDSPAATIGTALNNVNFIRAPITVVDAATLEINHVVDSTSMNNLRRAHIHEAVLFSYNETRSLIASTGTGTEPVKFSVHFPNPASDNGSYFWTVGGDHIAIGRNHAFDWDVITHEYGHYMQELNDTATNPGGRHIIDGNLAGFNQGAQVLTKEQGIQMAWAEGWPTYFGTFLQIAGGAAEFDIYTAGDLRYTDTGNNFSYDLESNASMSRARGEDVELAVQRILWDFADAPQDENDEVIFGHERMWTLLHSDPKPQTLNAFRAKFHDEIPPVGVSYYSAGTQEQNRAKYGGIYHDHGVGPAPITPEEAYAGNEAPTFSWQRRGAGPAPSYRFNLFTVQIYNKDLTEIVFTSPEIPTDAGVLTSATVAEWTPTAEEWEEIMEHGEILHWGVLGSHDEENPTTGPYLGLTRTIGGPSIAFVIDDTGSMWNEIDGVRAGLTLFIDALRIFAEIETPLIEVITFKDNVTHRTASRELDEIQGVIDMLNASGGADCPEASAQALAAAARNVAPGGTIIFATDASPHRGYDLAGIKNDIRSKGIIVNQFVTGDCESSSPDKGLVTGHMNDCLDCSSNPGYIPPPESETPVQWLYSVVCPDCPEDDAMGRRMTPNILRLVGDYSLPAVSSVAAFSDLASASPKGHFLYMPEVKYGDAEPFINAVANAALSALMPTVLAVQPTSGYQGTTMDVIIAGGSTNFNNTSSVDFSGTGITVNSVVAVSETEIVANITLAEDADSATVDVVVTTALGAETTEETVGEGQFRVMEATTVPSIISIVPKTIAQGTTDTLTITGINTNFSDGETEVLFGTGISTDAVSVTNATTLSVEISVAEDAPVGFRRVTVTTGAETVETNITLVLVETLGLGDDVPEIESITPRELPRGANNLELRVAGKSTSFEAEETSATFSGTGISVVSTIVQSPTEVILRVNVSMDAALGVRDVQLATGGETAVIIAGVVVVDLVPSGALRVVIEPEEARNAGAQWRLAEEEVWRDSGHTEEDVPVGEYTVDFKEINAWTAPAPQTVLVVLDETAHLEGTYTREAGEAEAEIIEGEDHEGEDDGDDGCCGGGGCGASSAKSITDFLGDFLLLGLALMALMALSATKK